MLDPLAQQIGVGGVFFLLASGLLLKGLPPMIKAMRGTSENHGAFTREEINALKTLPVVLIGVNGQGGLIREVAYMGKSFHWVGNCLTAVQAVFAKQGVDIKYPERPDR